MNLKTLILVLLALWMGLEAGYRIGHVQAFDVEETVAESTNGLNGGN